MPGWQATAFRGAIDSALALTSGSRAPWVLGNHDVPRPASRYRLDEGLPCRPLAAPAAELGLVQRRVAAG
jgi:hypothetical protein